MIHNFYKTRSHNAGNTRGFTLIELLIVMLILALLIGLGITIISIAYGESDQAATESLLQRVLNAETAWRTQVNSPTPHPGPIRDLVESCQDVPEAISWLEGAQNIFKRKDANGKLITLQDPWGEELNYANGVAWSIGPDRDGGTDDDIRTDGK